MTTEETIMKKTNNGIELIYAETGRTAFIVESIKTKGIVAPEINIATGKCRKPKGKKLFTFYVKKSSTEGLTLVSVI